VQSRLKSNDGRFRFGLIMAERSMSSVSKNKAPFGSSKEVQA
jgi:hypothetical protein